jgi:hypothetical protein
MPLNQSIDSAPGRSYGNPQCRPQAGQGRKRHRHAWHWRFVAGGQTLAQLAFYNVRGVGSMRAAPRLHFIDNLDPLSFEAMLTLLPLATMRFVAISKSCDTAEALMQTIAALSALKCRRARPRRSAQSGAAVHRRPARQTVQRRNNLSCGPGPAHGRRIGAACR